MSDIGSKIKQIRQHRHLTQQEVAEKMGVSRNYISQWESGTRRINADQLIQYAKIVGVTLDYFNDSSPERTLFQTMAQLDQLFMDASVPEADKDKAYQDIMKVYLRSKELTGISAATEEVEIYHDKNLPEAKEE